MRTRILYGIAAVFTVFLVTLAVLVMVAARGGSGSFIDLMRMGWFGLVFVRLVALIVVTIAVHQMWRVLPRFGPPIAALLAIAAGWFAVAKTVSPEGTYGYVGEIEPLNNAPELVPELYQKDHFWRFVHGEVQDCFGDFCVRYGPYERTAEGWTVVRDGEEPFTWKLKFSVLGFQLVGENGPTAYHPRRLLPFPRPYWMPDWLQ